jgi:hypothetical protein
LGGCVNGRTRAICGPITHASTLGCHARCARRPYATDPTSPTLPTPRGRHQPDPTATTPRRTGQPPGNAGHVPTTDPYTNCAARVRPKDGARPYQRGNTTRIDGTRRPPRHRHRQWLTTVRFGIRCWMAAQRVAHKLPPGTRNP